MTAEKKASASGWVIISAVVLFILYLIGYSIYDETKFEAVDEIPNHWIGTWKSNDYWDFHEQRETIVLGKKSLFWLGHNGFVKELEFERIEHDSDFPDLRLRLDFKGDPIGFEDAKSWLHFDLEDLQAFRCYCPMCGDWHSYSKVLPSY